LERRQDTAHQSDQDGSFSDDRSGGAGYANYALAAWFVLSIRALEPSDDEVGQSHV
jgi:hypothetical protein